MSQCEVTLAGVNTSHMPKDLQGRHPNLRINYFDIPWTLSTPGTGRVLVNSEQLREIEAKIEESDQLDLALTTLDPGGDSQILTLQVYPVRAEQLWGLTQATGLDEGWESMEKIEGLWSLEIHDKRTIWAMQCMDDPGNKLYVRNAQTLDGSWIESTVKKVNDNLVPYTLQEIMDQCLIRLGLVSVPVPDAYKEWVVRNLYLSGVPVTLAMDLLLCSQGDSLTMRFNPETSACGFTDHRNPDDVTKLLLDWVSLFMKQRLAGGRTRLYGHANRPSRTLVYTRTPVFAGPRDERVTEGVIGSGSYYTNAWPGTGQPAPGNLPDFSIRGGGTRREDAQGASRATQYRAAFAGIIQSALSFPLPINRLTYSWQSGFPVTEICVGTESPRQTITRSPFYHHVRGVPHRIAIGGDIFLPDEGGDSGEIRWAKIVECNKVSRLTRVQFWNDDGTALESTVVTARSSNFHEKDDNVRVARCKGRTPAYTIIDFMGFGMYMSPEEQGLSPVLRELFIPQRPICDDQVL